VIGVVLFCLHITPPSCITRSSVPRHIEPADVTNAEAMRGAATDPKRATHTWGASGGTVEPGKVHPRSEDVTTPGPKGARSSLTKRATESNEAQSRKRTLADKPAERSQRIAHLGVQPASRVVEGTSGAATCSTGSRRQYVATLRGAPGEQPGRWATRYPAEPSRKQGRMGRWNTAPSSSSSFRATQAARSDKRCPEHTTRGKSDATSGRHDGGRSREA
jgi:hypothetical protein